MSYAEAQPRGPIELPIDYPLTDVHLSIPAASPDPTAPGEQKFSMQLSWSNASNYDVTGSVADDDVPSCDDRRESCYVVDAEVRKAHLRYRVGLNNGREIAIHAPRIWRGGGTLDQAVEEFHSNIGVSGGVRGQVEQNRFEIKGRDGDSSFNFDDDGLALGNAVVSVKESVYSSVDSSASIQAMVSLPTGQGSYGHKGIDAAASLLLRESLSDFSFYLGGGPVIKSDETHYGIEYRRVHGEGFANVEYMLSEKLSLLAGTHASTRIVEGVEGHPNSAVYLDTGLKGDLEPLEWEFLFRENVSSGSGTTDFTLMLGVTATL